MTARTHKRCPMCWPRGDVLPAAACYHTPSRSDGLSSTCRQCHHLIEQKDYRTNAERERAVHSARRVSVRRANRARMIEYLSTRACAGCGIANPVVLEFHHVRGKKENRRAVSTLMCCGHWTRSLPRPGPRRASRFDRAGLNDAGDTGVALSSSLRLITARHSTFGA
jgi:hypothetical protein